VLTSLKAWFARAESRRQEDDSNLNQAKVSLSAGNFDFSASYANLVMSQKGGSRHSQLAASLLLIQTETRQNKFSGALDELELLLTQVPRSDTDLQAKVGNEIIRTCFHSGNLGMGTQRGEEFYRIYVKDWAEVDTVELLCQLSSCHFYRGDSARAEELMEKALGLAKLSKTPKAMTQSLWQASGLIGERGDLPLALEKVNEAKSWAQMAGLSEVIPILNRNTALIMLDLPDGDLSRIHELAESACLDLSTQNNPRGVAYACQILSEVALRREDYESALSYANKGLQELPPEVPGPKASLLVQVAKVYARLGNYMEAKTRLQVAAEHMEQLEPSKELAKQWGDLARVYVEVGLTDRGVYAYEKAIQMSGLLREEQESRVN
jgi:tetratricopeptide (TPR) repeat protein